MIKEELTLQYHNELNPLLWNGWDLKPIIRERLLVIAKLFVSFARIPDEAIEDIIFTGSSANFNYTPHSDIDVHLEVQMDKLPIAASISDDYLYDKKVLWTYRHQGLTVMGYPVEMYVANVNEIPSTDQGVYSLLDDHWIQMPKKLEVRDFQHDENLQKKIEDFKTKIEDILAGTQTNPVETINRLKEKFYNMRTAGLHREGEFSDENIIYKELRNLGFIDKLNEFLQKQNTASLTLA